MLRRYKGNPVIRPIKTHAWEKYVYNTAAIFEAGRVHLVYRALGTNSVSRFGYASSLDGFEFDERSEKPIFVPRVNPELRMVRFNNFGVEDPRITKIGDKFYMVYAATNGRIAQVALASIEVNDFLLKKWNWRRYGVLFPNWDNRNAVLFPEKINGKYVLYHRLKPSIWISYSKDLKNWSKPKIVMEPRKGKWDNLKIGAAGPPIKLEDYWLFIYHGVEQIEGRGIYRLGYALIDLKNPEKILYRSKDPILEPIKDYEKKGQVPDVVFSCGAIILGKKVLVYYGGADTVICLATGKVSDFVA